MKIGKTSVAFTGKKMVWLTPTILAYNTKPLSVPVALSVYREVADQRYSHQCKVKRTRKTRWWLVHTWLAMRSGQYETILILASSTQNTLLYAHWMSVLLRKKSTDWETQLSKGHVVDGQLVQIDYLGQPKNCQIHFLASYIAVVCIFFKCLITDTWQWTVSSAKSRWTALHDLFSVEEKVYHWLLNMDHLHTTLGTHHAVRTQYNWIQCML